MIPLLAAAALGLALLAAPAGATTDIAASAEQALETSRAAEGTTIGDHALIDHRGRPLRLAQFRGRPLVISMIYTSCHYTCPTMTQTLSNAIEAARKALGSDSFAVLSVGFDSRVDTPPMLSAFARQQGIDTDAWPFASGSRETIDRLAKEIGFTFFVAPRGFDHIAQTTIVDAQGRVYRQVYGETFDTPLVVEPLKDLILGRAASLTSVDGIINRVKFFCTVYDPNTGGYRFDYAIFIEFFMGLTSVILVAIFLIQSLRRRRST
ncbi:MAG: SCO family protein [Alphaproteobacteria bacterium]|nr:SCO family protein [Alphaproteobacteria bacterium]